jgi:NAD(P)-dependent dehydrogenase (short-subunit alcohol dehydrogenase family)
MKALVLGGYGTVGAVIVNTLRAAGDIALVAGRDPARADRVVDLHDPDTLRSATADVDVVVNASGIEDPDAVAALTEFGSAVVDITATTAYVAALERLDPARPVLVSVGLAPGLTNLLAATLHAKSPSDPIDIAVLLGAGERHGEASTQWAYGLLGHRFRDPGSGEEIRNYTRPRRFHVPGHRSRRLVRANYSDQHVLTRDLGVSVRTYFGLDSRLATAALAALTWLPGGSRAPRGPRLPGSDRWLVLARTDGATRWASGRSESRATAEVAAAAARIASPLPPGVHHLHTVATRADVPLGSAIHLG